MRNSTQKFNLIQKNSSSYFHIEFINTFAGIKVCDLLSKIYADGQKKKSRLNKNTKHEHKWFVYTYRLNRYQFQRHHYCHRDSYVSSQLNDNEILFSKQFLEINVIIFALDNF